jgi:aspartate/methionine/tyrosine aminotransferase
MLVKKADQGVDVIVIVDDAYFGLFYDEHAAQMSFYTQICGIHERIFAIKCDAATKESLVWGFRIGFITYGHVHMNREISYALEQKTMGALRASVSSCSRIGQSLLLAVMNNSSYHEEIAAAQKTIAHRYAIVQRELSKYADCATLQPYPFNSGYFCTLHSTVDAQQLRKRLLERCGIGIVALGDHTIRIAYSAIDDDQIPVLIDTLYREAEALWK